jgi:trimeric autotransporter adhesin
MKSVEMRGSLVAAVATIFVLATGITTSAQAQQTAALAANPELAAKGAWDPGTTYVIDDLVTSRGSTWRSKRNNNLNKVPGQTQPSSATYWELFARGFNPAGAWLNSTKYQPDDLVTHLGQTYRAKITNTNKTPTNTTNWELLAAKGADGDDGATGATGATGPAGPNTGIGDGTASAPSISFTGDSDTGMYHPGANKIALVEGGSLFLHNLGTANTSLGLNALKSLTTGVQNTALGDEALRNNTTGTSNTAVGYLALGSNTAGQSNTAFGESTLQANIGGSYNVAVGNSALLLNSSGNNNVVMGVVAMTSNTTGATNVAIGNSSLYANTQGSQNIAIGDSALHDNTTGGKNIAVGREALRSNSTGENNIALGYQALQNSTTTDNTAIGYQALKAQTTGLNNTAVGSGALAANTEGPSNVAVGMNALAGNTTGEYNSALGTLALQFNTTGVGNTGFGANALRSNQSGFSNTAIGTGALQSAASGNNTAVGFLALNAVTTGTDNIALGYLAGWETAANSTNSIYIGNPGLSGDTNTIKIGTEGGQQSTFIAGIRGVATGQNNATAVFIDSDGQLGTTNSSRRYKYDIETMADVSAMLGRLRPVTFRYNKPQNGGQHPLQYGLIAEEVADVFPDLAVFNKDGTPETVKYHLLPSFLLAGYQAQQTTIATQADKIEALEQRLRRLEALLPPTRAASIQ